MTNNPYAPGPGYPYPYNPQQQPSQTAWPTQAQYPAQYPYAQPAMPPAPLPNYGAPPPNFYPPAPGVQYPPPTPVATPQGWFMPNQALLESSYRRAEERQEQVARARSGESRSQYVFFKILGPHGQEKWDESVPTNYEGWRPFHLLGAWDPNVLHYVEGEKHFWKSKERPQGAGFWCPGKENCRVCQARDYAFKTGNERLVEIAKTWGKARPHYIFQGFALDDLQSHVDEAGIIRPQILDCGATLFADIKRLQIVRGVQELIDPYQGRPLRVTKKKTGPSLLDVEYSVLDLSPAPIPPEFHPEQLNLHDLSKLIKLPTETEMQQAVAEMELELPGLAGKHAQAGTTYAYSPNPNPPEQNPYIVQAPTYTGTELPTMGAPTATPVPVPASPPGVTHYSPQPSRAGTPPAFSSGPPQPVSQGAAPPPPPPSMAPTVPAPSGAAAPPPGFVNPKLSELEAQLRGSLRQNSNSNSGKAPF